MSEEKEKTEPQSSFAVLSDEQLIEIYRSGDVKAQNYLLDKYKSFVKLKANKYFLVGADKEDMAQEGMIGLFKAIRDYRPDKQASFKRFAELCVERQIISFLKSANRQKHKPLNSSESLDGPVATSDEGSERPMLEVTRDCRGVEPENLLVDQEEFLMIEKNVRSMLSLFERQVLCAYLESKSYQDISKEMGRSTKSIDNALQRVKRKLEKFLATNEQEVDVQTLNRGLLLMAAKMRLEQEQEMGQIDRIETIPQKTGKKTKKISSFAGIFRTADE